MLVLSRKLGEKVFIGDNICITIVDTERNNKVRLGIEAPKDIRIEREELRIKRIHGTPVQEPTPTPPSST